MRIVRNEGRRERAIEYGMAAALDANVRGFRDGRARPMLSARNTSETRECVEFSGAFAECNNVCEFTRDRRQQLRPEFFLTIDGACIGAQDFLLELFQFGRDVPFGVAG
jgi:hypothetical protein